MKHTLHHPLPFSFPLTSPRGNRSLDNGRTFHWHKGIDIAAPIGTPVKAAAAGRVVMASNVNGYGLTVRIEHTPHLFTHYAHLDSMAVKLGDFVATQSVIGRVGSTGMSQGPHLDFEVLMRNDLDRTDLEPLDYLRDGWAWALAGLRPGLMRNPRVRALQQLLNRETRAALETDGSWGNLTSIAMRNLCGSDKVEDLLVYLRLAD